jgi:NTP pyrophosphatase (non-canonical NTP hydrolase)
MRRPTPLTLDVASRPAGASAFADSVAAVQYHRAGGGGTMKPTLDDLTARLVAFRDARDWRRFHGTKNLMQSVAIEAAEILELAQWKDDAAVEAALDDPAFRARLGEECADVLLYLLMICERAGIDLAQAADAKIDRNGVKDPVEKSRGRAVKYTEL